jgi:SAM-dependent methyltransferase
MSSRNETNDNPWLHISAEDYEGHMNSPEVDQLLPLSQIFADVYRRCRPKALAILGCTTGNGFDCVDVAVTSRLVGVDINRMYLDIARTRYPHLESIMELVCAPVETCEFPSGAFDLVHAGLIFEYLDPADILTNIAGWLSPGGTLSVVLQLPSVESGAVSKTAFDSLKILEGVMRLVPPEDLTRLADGAGLRPLESRTVPLRRGKSFMVQLFRNDGNGSRPGSPAPDI